MRSRAWRGYVIAVKAGLLLLVVLNAVGIVWFVRDSRRLDALAHELVDPQDPQSVQAQAVFDFLVDLPVPTPDKYFLLPVFRPLRPTAAQIVDAGGDCAYKARALIVLLRKLDIDAHKIGLHDRDGQPTHAVAMVTTEKGRTVFDLAFHVVFVHEDGTPMSTPYIADHLEEVIQQEIGRGNTHAASYSVELYRYDTVTTINWHKSPVWRSTRTVLGLFMKEDAIDALPRPYMSEEPALMVMTLSALGGALLILPIGVSTVFGLLRRRTRKRDGANG